MHRQGLAADVTTAVLPSLGRQPAPYPFNAQRSPAIHSCAEARRRCSRRLAFLRWPCWASSAAPARAASAGTLQQQINAGAGHLSGLSGAVSAASGRVKRLGSAIAGMQHQIASIQADLNVKRLELLALRRRLTTARSRLAVLEAAQARAQGVLARRLVSTYETARPDLVSVVLEATGFQNLLERLAFARRIQNEDVQVVGDVRAARRAVAAQATRLGALEVRQQAVTTEILLQRNKLARAQAGLVEQQLAAAQTRVGEGGQARQRAGSRRIAAPRSREADGADRRTEYGDTELADTQFAGVLIADREQRRVHVSDAEVRCLAAGHVEPRSGRRHFGARRHAGAGGLFGHDRAPRNRRVRAVGAGAALRQPDCRLQLRVLRPRRSSQPAPGRTHVGAGQVMSSVGPGIVGISSGPHLELGFCDSSGTPIGPQTAGTMLSLLQSSY